jgi:hypothetical protein
MMGRRSVLRRMTSAELIRLRNHGPSFRARLICIARAAQCLPSKSI